MISNITDLKPLALAEHLFSHYESVHEVKHYYGLLAIYGLCVTSTLSGSPALQDRCRALLARFPDEIEHPQYNFPSYTIGGIPRAYMLASGLMTDDRTRALVSQYADEMMNAPRDAAGILCAPWAKDNPASKPIWIDVAMAATPFLLFSGLALKRPELIDEAARQAILMYETFLDPETGLLFQCRGFIAPGIYSTDHWSRGNGWGIIALTELVQHLPRDSKHLPTVLTLLKNHLNALLPFQNTRGLWCQQVSMPEDPRNWEESSGSALFLYALGTALRINLLGSDDAYEAFALGCDGLLRYCVNEDFSTDGCCHGCLSPGTGEMRGTPEAYMTLCKPVHDEPHSFGPIILALTALHQLTTN